MLRDKIRNTEKFNSEEKEKLIEIVEDLYFYWTKFEILKDSVVMARNFSKPSPNKYMSPLSEIPRLDLALNYNSFVVAFVNAACFFEPSKRRKDDRFLLDFLKKTNDNNELLYKLSVFLYNDEGLVVPYSNESFKIIIENLINELELEIEKEYIKEIKLYRHKVLSHHTYVKPHDFKEEVSDFLMEAVNFLEEFLLLKVSRIITQVYHSNLPPIIDSINLFRRKMKPNLMDIVEVTVEFKIDDETIKNKILEDELYEQLKNIMGMHKYEEKGNNIILNYFNYSSFYDREINEGIKDNGQLEVIHKIIHKYKIFGSMVNQSIVDQ